MKRSSEFKLVLLFCLMFLTWLGCGYYIFFVVGLNSSPHNSPQSDDNQGSFGEAAVF